MSLEIRIDDLVRTPKEELAPGTVITGLNDYQQVSGLINIFGRKLPTEKGRFAVEFSSPSAKRDILIENGDFRSSKRFLGRIKPELALIVPAASVSSVWARHAQELYPEGLALLLRYRLKSTGKDRIYLVECSFFRKIAARLVWVFAKERESKDAMGTVLARRVPNYAEELREGLDRMYATP